MNTLTIIKQNEHGELEKETLAVSRTFNRHGHTFASAKKKIRGHKTPYWYVYEVTTGFVVDPFGSNTRKIAEEQAIERLDHFKNLLPTAIEKAKEKLESMEEN